MSAIVLTLSACQKEPIRVACVGDSITYGHGIKDRENDTYPGLLKYMLGDKYDVRNFGVSGTTTMMNTDMPYMNEQAYKDALARFNEDWARRARGADLDEKKSGNDGNLAKAWGSGEGGINGDVETDPEVIELRRREQNGTLSASAAKRLAELTGGGSSDETEARPANEAESVSEPAAEPEPEVPTSVRDALVVPKSNASEASDTPAKEPAAASEHSDAPWESARDAGGVYYSDPTKVEAVKRTMGSTDTWAGRIAAQYGINPDDISAEDTMEFAYRMDQAKRTPKGSDERKELRTLAQLLANKSRQDSIELDDLSAYEAERRSERGQESQNRADTDAIEDQERAQRIADETAFASNSDTVKNAARLKNTNWMDRTLEGAGDALETAGDYYRETGNVNLSRAGAAVDRVADRGFTAGWNDPHYTDRFGQQRRDVLVDIGNAGRTIKNIGMNAIDATEAAIGGALGSAQRIAGELADAAGGSEARGRKNTKKLDDAAPVRREEQRMQHIGQKIAQNFNVTPEERAEYNEWRAHRSAMQRRQEIGRSLGQFDKPADTHPAIAQTSRGTTNRPASSREKAILEAERAKKSMNDEARLNNALSRGSSEDPFGPDAVLRTGSSDDPFRELAVDRTLNDGSSDDPFADVAAARKQTLSAFQKANGSGDPAQVERLKTESERLISTFEQKAKGKKNTAKLKKQFRETFGQDYDELKRLYLLNFGG